MEKYNMQIVQLLVIEKQKNQVIINFHSYIFKVLIPNKKIVYGHMLHLLH